MRPGQASRPLRVSKRDRELLEPLRQNAARDVARDVGGAGSLPRRRFVVISQAEAALTITAFEPFESLRERRVDSRSSPSSHQSRAWVSRRSDATAFTPGGEPSSGKPSRKASPVAARPFMAPKRRSATTPPSRTIRATGFPRARQHDVAAGLDLGDQFESCVFAASMLTVFIARAAA